MQQKYSVSMVTHCNKDTRCSEYLCTPPCVICDIMLHFVNFNRCHPIKDSQTRVRSMCTHLTQHKIAISQNCNIPFISKYIKCQYLLPSNAPPSHYSDNFSESVI